MTADKPEAGRTCKPWCGTETESGTGPCWMDARNYYCTEACRNNGAPVNPAPRPVEPPRGNCDCRAPGGMPHAPGCKVEPPLVRTAVGDVHPDSLAAPRPVERCSCEEATRYKAALEKIRGMVDKRTVIADIARRALALGGDRTP